MGYDNNITYVATFVRKTKRLAWTLKQDKKQTAQNNLFSGYNTCQEDRIVATRQRICNNGVQGQGIQGERDIYAAVDIRNWLTMGNSGESASRGKGVMAEGPGWGRWGAVRDEGRRVRQNGREATGGDLGGR